MTKKYHVFPRRISLPNTESENSKPFDELESIPSSEKITSVRESSKIDTHVNSLSDRSAQDIENEVNKRAPMVAKQIEQMVGHKRNPSDQSSNISADTFGIRGPSRSSSMSLINVGGRMDSAEFRRWNKNNMETLRYITSQSKATPILTL